jgi:ubiquinone/menaquinone biosynthesis C-methylase UbiE
LALHTRSSEGSSSADPRREYFDRLAPDWDVRGQDPARTLQRLDELRDLLDLSTGEDLLEVGCGTGQITGWLQQAVAPGRVLGVDFAAEMVLISQRKHPQLEFRVADVCTDDMGDACFDVALCFHSFPHFRDKPAAVGNLARTLRPGGRLLVMHLAGSARINAMHSGFGGVVAGDHLPSAEAWPGLLAGTRLHVLQLLDRDDLFLLIARKAQ